MSEQLSKCCTCGHEWPTGRNGSHSCAEHLIKQRDALLAFALEIMRDGIEATALDGCDIQDMAVKHGLMTVEEREERCQEEGCSCAEYGFPAQCYRIRPELLALEVKPC